MRELDFSVIQSTKLYDFITVMETYSHQNITHVIVVDMTVK